MAIEKWGTCWWSSLDLGCSPQILRQVVKSQKNRVFFSQDMIFWKGNIMKQVDKQVQVWDIPRLIALSAQVVDHTKIGEKNYSCSFDLMILLSDLSGNLTWH